MPTQKATTNARTPARTTVSRVFRTDASKPGAPVMTLRAMATGGPGYGWFMGLANIGPSGVARVADDTAGDIPVIGMYAVLGGKQGEGVSITFDTAPNSFTAQKVSGQIRLVPTEETGFTTFTFMAGAEKSTTVENVKINAVREREEPYKK